MTHTQGDWYVYGVDGNHQPLVMSRSSRLIAVCAHECVDEQGAHSNAHLIAAAPDLLAALEDLLHHTSVSSAGMNARKNARAAIAKAKGE